MPRRRRVPPSTEADVLVRCARRCAICYGLNQDTQQKRGQIAHLDRDPSNIDPDNLVYLCLEHHDQYDSRTSQSKGLTIAEAREYRELLYEAMTAARGAPWPAEGDAPLLDHWDRVGPTAGILHDGIRFTDSIVQGAKGLPSLYLSIYFKWSRYFGSVFPARPEKWLYVVASVPPALSLSVQVRALSERDVEQFMCCLRGERAYELRGPAEGSAWHCADYLYVGQPEGGVHSAVVSTFMETGAQVAVRARLSERAANALAEYLRGVGWLRQEG